MSRPFTARPRFASPSNEISVCSGVSIYPMTDLQRPVSGLKKEKLKPRPPTAKSLRLDALEKRREKEREREKAELEEELKKEREQQKPTKIEQDQEAEKERRTVISDTGEEDEDDEKTDVFTI